MSIIRSAETVFDCVQWHLTTGNTEILVENREFRNPIHTYIHTYITICRARCVDSTEYTSNQRRWRQSLGGQLLASKVISFQVALKAVQ